jgi:hypothetical protein
VRVERGHCRTELATPVFDERNETSYGRTFAGQCAGDQIGGRQLNPLSLEGDDLGDAGDPIAQKALNALLESDRRDGAAFTCPVKTNHDATVFDPEELNVASIHLNRRANELQGVSDLVFYRDHRPHPLILPGALLNPQGIGTGL